MDYLSVELLSTLKGHQNPVFSLENGFFANTLFSGGNDKGVVEWDLQTHSFKRILCSVTSSVYSLHLIPGTPYLAIGLREGIIMIVDVENQKLVTKLNLSQGAVFDIKTLVSKRELIAVGEDGYAYVWCLDNFSLLYQFRIAETLVRTIAISSDQKQLAFGSKDGSIHLYDALEYHLISSVVAHTHPVTALTFDPNGQRLLSGGRDARLVGWSTTDLTEQLAFIPHMFTVYGIHFHPIYPFFITVSRDKTIKVWDKETYGLLRNVSRDRGFDSHHLSINVGIWSPDGKLFITAGDDKIARVWQVEAQP